MHSPVVFEALMLICFGLAWPLATLRMLRSGRADGRGLGFTLVILAGYLAGVMSKLLGLHDGTGLPPVFWLYVLNSLSVGVNAALQWRYTRRAVLPQPLPSAV
jgi:hypothetical protein